MAKDANEGLENCAMLLLTLGSDDASEVLKLTCRRAKYRGLAQRYGQAAHHKPREAGREAGRENFSWLRRARFAHRARRGDDPRFDVLTKALGDERAANLISRVLQGSDNGRHQNR